jgi:hypothetical protein
MERTDAHPTSTDTPPAPAPESDVLSAHTLGILARHVADRLSLDPAAQAFAVALDDVAVLADAWVQAQLNALASLPQSTAQAAARPLVAPTVAPAAPTPARPATDPQPLTATAAVLAATSVLSDSATARDIAQHIAAQHQLDLTPGSVRAILSRERAKAQAQQPAQQPFGFSQGGGQQP